MVTRLFSLAAVSLIGIAAVSSPAQIPGPDSLRPALETALEVGTESMLERSLQRMREAAPEPARDAERYKSDSAYRREHQAAVKKAAERRKQLALQFLDRFDRLLDDGAGLYYQGLARKFAGDCPRAVVALQTFRLTVRRHRLRTQSLVELVDCLLEDDPDLSSADGRERERRRLRKAGTYLESLGRETLDPRQESAVKALQARQAASLLRLAYYDLIDRLDDIKRSVVRAEIDRVLRDNKDTDEDARRFLERVRGDENLLDSLIRDPAEETYHLSVPVRREYWNLRARTAWRVQDKIRGFYQEHRKDLDAVSGLLWKARARRLAGDAKRAAAAFRRFRTAFPGHREAVEVGLEEARLHLHALDEPEAARETLEELTREALTPEQTRTVEALTLRVKKELEARDALRHRVGRAWTAIPVVESVGARPDLTPAGLKGGVTVLLHFAAWSAPSRAALRDAAELARVEPGIRVVGITRFFGFGWEPPSPATPPAKKEDAEEAGKGNRTENPDEPRDPDSRLEGQPVGPDLTRDRERELCAGLWRAAGLEGPLVFTTPEVLDALPGLPAVVIVDDRGVQRYAAVGGVQGFKGVRDVIRKLLER